MRRLDRWLIAAVVAILVIAAAALTTSGGGDALQVANPQSAHTASRATSVPDRTRLAAEWSATTTSTAAPVPPARASRSQTTAVPRSATPHPAPGPAVVAQDTSGCLGGWNQRMSAEQRRARAHACWDGLIAQYAWNQATAFRIMMCESGGNPYAVGPPTRYGRAKGLMQIMGYGSFDPATNMAQAWNIYSRRGWSPWVCR